VPLRCLIVDDSPSFLEAARVLLEREGLDVAGVAANGEEAVRRVKELRPDVVLVDLMLGDESGFDVVARLAAESNGDGLTTILISTDGAADFEDLLATSPAAGFVPKSELSGDAVRRIVEGRSGDGSAPR
jgi:DNA-binding NarL/FixJ family response regulator